MERGVVERTQRHAAAASGHALRSCPSHTHVNGDWYRGAVVLRVKPGAQCQPPPSTQAQDGIACLYQLGTPLHGPETKAATYPHNNDHGLRSVVGGGGTLVATVAALAATDALLAATVALLAGAATLLARTRGSRLLD